MDRRQDPHATATPSWSEEATEAYTEHRELLFSIAYRILGSVADTEDVLQDVWLSWAAADRGDVENPRAYLVRMTANGAMRRLDAPHRRHETYTGPWVPEPLVTGDDASVPATRADTASVALLIVLETLSPLERTVFVLREAFGYPHAEIARMLGRTSAAVRQVARRARVRVRERQPRFPVTPERRRAVTERFVRAALGGDIKALLDLLDPDVEVWTDGGAAGNAARHVLRGRDHVVRLFTGLHAKGMIPAMEIEPLNVNHDPAVLLRLEGEVFGVVVTEPTSDGERLRAVYAVVNPDKLRAVRRALGEE